MIRKRTLLIIGDKTEQICCQLSETGCNCDCQSCDGGNDCVDCPDLTIADINLFIALAGDYNNQLQPNFVLMYPAFTFDNATNTVCFFLDAQLFALQNGRYIGQVQVKGKPAGNIDFQLGTPFSICKPTTLPAQNQFNDMQP